MGKIEISEEVKKLVKENAQINHNRRKKIHDEAIAKEKKEWESKHKKPFGSFPFRLDEGEIWPEELEKEDYNEIVNLINQIDQAKKDKVQAQAKARNEKVASRSDLFYWGGGKRWGGGYFGFPEWADPRWRSLEGKSYCGFLKKQSDNPSESWSLEINSNHPYLDNFSFEKEGFYIIKGIENLPWEPSPYNGTAYSSQDWFYKFVESNDKITITPYEVENNNELSETEKKELEIKDCDICQKNENEMDNGTEKWYVLRRYHGQKSQILHACSNCYKSKKQEYLQNYEFIFTSPIKDLTHEGIPFNIENIKGGKIDCYANKKDPNGQILPQQNCSHCQPWKSHHTPNLKISKIDIKSLIQYFQEHSIKKIKLINGEVIITYNVLKDNKALSIQQIDNSQELQLAKDMAQKTNNQELTMESLEKMNNTTTPNNNALWIGIGIGGALILIFGIMVNWLVRKRKNKKNK